MKTVRYISTISGCALAAISFGAMLLQEAQATTKVQTKFAPQVKSVQKVKTRCPAARGVGLSIRSFFTVTNSDDGFKDNDVEVYGVVNIGGQQVWRVARNNARSINNKSNPNSPQVETTGVQWNEIETSSRTFDVIFDDSKTWNIVVNGFLNDRDKASKDDGMWNSFQMPQIVNLKNIAPSLKRRGQVEYRVLRGDRDSESADLTLMVSKLADIY